MPAPEFASQNFILEIAARGGKVLGVAQGVAGDALVCRRRRATKPSPANPISIIAQVEGSVVKGAKATPLNVVSAGAFSGGVKLSPACAVKSPGTSVTP